MVIKSLKSMGSRRGRGSIVNRDPDQTMGLDKRGVSVRKGVGKLMKLQARDYKENKEYKRWRLQHVREHVRVFVEEERALRIEEGAMGTPALVLLVGAGLAVAVAGAFTWRASESVLCGLVAMWVVSFVFWLALGFGLVQITGNAAWTKTGRVRADCWLACHPDTAFAFVSAPDAGVRREASSWFEAHVVRTFDAHTSLVDVVEVAPAGWPRLMASRPRVSPLNVLEQGRRRHLHHSVHLRPGHGRGRQQRGHAEPLLWGRDADGGGLPTPHYYVSAAIYWIVPRADALTDPADVNLRARVAEFCDTLTDAQRDDVMKIVPRMVEGPWVAKHAVGQKPALLGHAITCQYHSGPGWFEMDVDISSSSTAAGALRILKSCSKSLVVDLAFVLKSQKPGDLPEKVLGTVEWNHFDLDPDNSPVIKLSSEDN